MDIVGIERCAELSFDESVRDKIIKGADFKEVFLKQHREGTVFYAYLQHFSEVDKTRLWECLVPVLFYLKGAVAIVTEVAAMPASLHAVCRVTHYSLPACGDKLWSSTVYPPHECQRLPQISNQNSQPGLDVFLVERPESTS